MTRKTFVVDTNVLIYEPEAIIKFADNDVVVPLTVIEELDSLKKYPDERGKNARAVIRLFDDLKRIGKGDLRNGVKMKNGGTVRILLDYKTDYKANISLAINDNKIIMAACLLLEKGERVVFVSKDFAARVKAEAIGLEAADYENLKADFDQIYKGVREVHVAQSDIDVFHKDGGFKIAGAQFCPNEYCILSVKGVKGGSVVGKFCKATGRIEPLLKTHHVKSHHNLWGIKPLNIEQECAIDLLLRDDIKLVSLVGAAGTGKTLIALAVAMRKVFDEGVYTRILVSRPIMPLGKDIGYLPGTKDEKLLTWMQPIYDNLEFLCDCSGNEPSETLRWVLDSKKIELEAVTYIRGRTLPKMFMIIDEAQNLTPHEIKTVISRAGQGTKVVLTGDPTQIDSPYLDKDSNGLTVTIGKFKNSELFGNMFLETTERSELAALAANIM